MNAVFELYYARYTAKGKKKEMLKNFFLVTVMIFCTCGVSIATEQPYPETPADVVKAARNINKLSDLKTTLLYFDKSYIAVDANGDQLTYADCEQVPLIWHLTNQAYKEHSLELFIRLLEQINRVPQLQIRYAKQMGNPVTLLNHLRRLTPEEKTAFEQFLAETAVNFNLDLLFRESTKSFRILSCKTEGDSATVNTVAHKLLPGDTPDTVKVIGRTTTTYELKKIRGRWKIVSSKEELLLNDPVSILKEIDAANSFQDLARLIQYYAADYVEYDDGKEVMNYATLEFACQLAQGNKHKNSEEYIRFIADSFAGDDFQKLAFPFRSSVFIPGLADFLKIDSDSIRHDSLFTPENRRKVAQRLKEAPAETKKELQRTIIMVLSRLEEDVFQYDMIYKIQEVKSSGDSDTAVFTVLKIVPPQMSNEKVDKYQIRYRYTLKKVDGLWKLKKTEQ